MTIITSTDRQDPFRGHTTALRDAPLGDLLVVTITVPLDGSRPHDRERLMSMRRPRPSPGLDARPSRSYRRMVPEIRIGAPDPGDRASLHAPCFVAAEARS